MDTSLLGSSLARRASQQRAWPSSSAGRMLAGPHPHQLLGLLLTSLLLLLLGLESTQIRG